MELNYTKQDFIKLKSDKFSYCDKSYEKKRYISKDGKVYLTSDDNNYIRFYIGQKDGKAKNIDLKCILHGKNQYGYPYYTFESILNDVNKYLLDKNLHTINIHKSHCK